MSIITDIFAHMTAHPGLAALIADRCYPMTLPQDPTLPAVTYQRIGTISLYSHDGNTGLYHARWQFSCWSLTYTEGGTGAFDVAQQVQEALNLWAASHDKEPAFLENALDLYDPETQIYHIPVDATIWWKE